TSAGSTCWTASPHEAEGPRGSPAGSGARMPADPHPVRRVDGRDERDLLEARRDEQPAHPFGRIVAPCAKPPGTTTATGPDHRAARPDQGPRGVDTALHVGAEDVAEDA